MSLAEKRVMNIVETRDVPAHRQEIANYLGREPTLTVDWDSFAGTSESGLFNVRGGGLRRVADAMLKASHDAFVKSAFAQAVTAIRIVAAPDATQKSLEFADGMLTLKIYTENTDDGCFSGSEIHQFLVQKL